MLMFRWRQESKCGWDIYVKGCGNDNNHKVKVRQMKGTTLFLFSFLTYHTHLLY